jgi:hypothetical protein
MTVAQNLSTGQNESAPGVGITEGGELNQSAAGAALNWATDAPFSAQRRGRVNGAVSCPIQTFTSDRQRMLRSWLALQGAAPAHVLADELVATISAMRQLMEVSCDDERKR